MEHIVREEGEFKQDPLEVTTFDPQEGKDHQQCGSCALHNFRRYHSPAQPSAVALGNMLDGGYSIHIFEQMNETKT